MERRNTGQKQQTEVHEETEGGRRKKRNLLPSFFFLKDWRICILFYGGGFIWIRYRFY